MDPAVIQTVSGVVGSGGGFDWGLLFAGLAAGGTLLTALFYWIWSKRLTQVQRRMNAWQAQQKRPELLCVKASIKRVINEQRVKFYPGHGGSSDEHFGYTVKACVNNPGEVPVHVLRTQLVLPDMPFTGVADRKFRSESQFALIPPHSLKDFFLFAKDPAATTADEWPAARFLIEYVSGSKAERLTLQLRVSPSGPPSETVPMDVVEADYEEM